MPLSNSDDALLVIRCPSCGQRFKVDNDLRGLRDKAILAIGFAGGLRRSEIVAGSGPSSATAASSRRACCTSVVQSAP